MRIIQKINHTTIRNKIYQKTNIFIWSFQFNGLKKLYKKEL